MLRFILDRSCDCAGFALAQADQVICKKLWEGGAARSPAWLVEMCDVMAASGYCVDEVDEFVCCIGPGSFSGIRAALAACAGMALPGAKSVSGISSAAVLAFQYAGSGSGVVTVIGDARRSRFWCASYQLSQDGSDFTLFSGAPITNTAEDFELLTIEELDQRVPPEALILSPDWDRVGDLLTARFSAEQLVMQKLSPKIDLMARLAHQMPALLRREPLPIYLHPAVVVAGV